MVEEKKREQTVAQLRGDPKLLQAVLADLGVSELQFAKQGPVDELAQLGKPRAKGLIETAKSAA